MLRGFPLCVKRHAPGRIHPLRRAAQFVHKRLADGARNVQIAVFCSLLTRHYRVFSLVIELDKSARFGHSQRARSTRFPWGRLQSAPYEGVSVFVNPFVTKSGDEVDELGFGVDPYFLINMTTMSDGRTFSDEESLLYAVQTMAARKNP